MIKPGIRIASLGSLMILMSGLTLPAFAQISDPEFNFKNAFDYNNYIVREISSTVQKNFDYIAFSVNSEEYDQLDNRRREVISGIAGSRARIAQMPALNGDTRLKDDAVTVLTEYQRAFEQDYQRIILLKRKSRDSFEAMQAYFKAEDDAEFEMNKATRRLLKAQGDFAKKYNLNVVGSKADDELEKKMDKVLAVNNYWRTIFLDYFRVSIVYEKLWDVLPDQKAGAIDHERLIVIKMLDQVLPVLRSRSDFKGNQEFRDQTINVLEYYQRVAMVDFARIVDLLGKKNLQQTDAEEINGIISRCNADQERLTYNWNIALQQLLKMSVERQ